MRKLVAGKLYILTDDRTVINVKSGRIIVIPKNSTIMYIKTLKNSSKESNLRTFQILYGPGVYSLNTGMVINSIFKEFV